MNVCDVLAIAAIKRGDTFTLVGTYKEGGTAVSVAAFDIRAMVRDLRNRFIAELVITKANQSMTPGRFTISGGNIDWEPGDYLCDIEFVSGGLIRSTQTFLIPVVIDITYD